MMRYGTACDILEKYVGTGGKKPRPEELDLFVTEVLQELLHSGAHGNERTFSFRAQNGIITLPKELETPLKVKIDGAVGNVWNQWFEYHSGIDIGETKNSFITLPDRFPCVYDVPEDGRYIAVTGSILEDDDAHIVVKGEDAYGRVIHSNHQGENVIGEYLQICKGRTVRSQMKFGRITEVYKTKTNGYVQLIWVGDEDERGYLSDYEPTETMPSYQRIRLEGRCPPVCSVKVLGRIRLKEHYGVDDLIPFDNVRLISLGGQTVYHSNNNDMQTAIAKESMIANKIQQEGNYKNINVGQPIEVYFPTSGGAIKSPNARNIRRRRFR